MQVGVGNPLVGDQGLLHETHHIPSQHNEVRSMLVKPVHTMPSVESTPLEHRIDQIIACSAISLSPPEQRSENQEVLFNLSWTILLKMLLLDKDALDHLLILCTYTQKEISCCYFCWLFTHAIHFLCNIVYELYLNMNFETGSAAAEES
jgi:hypothetical protein